MSRAYFRLLAEHGLLRDDLDIEAIAYAFQATFEGFRTAVIDLLTDLAETDRADLGIAQA
jgi:hypothetical protein